MNIQQYRLYKTLKNNEVYRSETYKLFEKKKYLLITIKFDESTYRYGTDKSKVIRL